jgi:poly(3-hydroxybutyrate) depolymerase
MLAAALLAALSVWPGAAQQGLPEGVQRRLIRSGHESHAYFIYNPPKADKDKPLPLMLLVPSAGLTGLNEMAGWNKVVEANPMILVGIDVGMLSADWDDLFDHPEWVHGAVEEARKVHPVDGRHMYIWGESSGAAFAFYFAFLESQYFAAAAVHAGVIRNFRFQMADFAARKIPIAYYIGTRDGWWTLEQTRSVRDALTQRGFPVHYVELKGADHNFFSHMDDVTGDAWEYLSQQSLEADPKFEPLDMARIKHALR